MCDEIIDLRSASVRLLQEALVLNSRHEVETSPLGMERLVKMLRVASFSPCFASGKAFLIAFDDTADYDGASYQWFRREMSGFVYVDRVIVATSAQGDGLGRCLYGCIETDAAARGFRALVCEVNIDPPNPGSLAFHRKLGFREVGRGAVPSGKKVMYLRKSIQ
jgi:predicted GNAT superfamily acetyltransferase